jgi:subtilase family serine protease
MRKASLLAVAVTATAVAVAVGLGTSAGAAPGAASAAPAAGKAPVARTTHACTQSIGVGFAHCDAVIRTDLVSTAKAGSAGSASKAGAAAPNATVAGFGPADLAAAYKLPTSAGAGQTVAIVDAMDDPNAESDLATYRANFGIPACTSANGCFKKVNQRGQTTNLPRSDAGWAAEISLDLDMVSAVCPRCNILLVEASSASFANLGTAVNRAVTMGAKFVSNSYGGSESSASNSAYNHPGVVVTASSGDSGFGVEQPASFNSVTAVGGTSLRRDSSARGFSETVWNGAGSGCSAVVTKPAFQSVVPNSVCSRRTVADVSAVADPNTGVAVFDSFREPGWLVFGGTSVSAPIIASVYALAGTPAAGSTPAAFPYSHTSSLFDVTSGSNGSCSGSLLCTGKVGYDGPTGLGTPNGTGAFTQ